MEQAHTQLIAQLNERILAADNTPLYIKFAETVKNAVRSGVAAFRPWTGRWHQWSGGF